MLVMAMAPKSAAEVLANPMKLTPSFAMGLDVGLPPGLSGQLALVDQTPSLAGPTQYFWVA